MTGARHNPKVDVFQARMTQWRDEFVRLRAIVLDCPVTEELKWGQPCYTSENRNIVLFGGFKDYCALLFVKGALMKDPEGILVQQTANVQSGRHIRFTNVSEIDAAEAVLKAYIRDAIQVEMSGAKVAFKNTDEFPVPDELLDKFDSDPAFAEAFRALTPGRQRAYLLHFAEAKQSKTRVARIEKFIPAIYAGKGPLEIARERYKRRSDDG